MHLGNMTRPSAIISLYLEMSWAGGGVEQVDSGSSHYSAPEPRLGQKAMFSQMVLVVVSSEARVFCIWLYPGHSAVTQYRT